MFRKIELQKIANFFNNLPKLREGEIRVLVVLKRYTDTGIDTNTSRCKILETILLKQNTFEEFIKKLKILMEKDYGDDLKNIGIFIDILPKSETKGVKLFIERAMDIIEKEGKIFGSTALLVNSIRKANAHNNYVVVCPRKFPVSNPSNISLYYTLYDKSKLIVSLGDETYFVLHKKEFEKLKKQFPELEPERFTEIPVPLTKCWNKLVYQVK